MLVSWTFRLLLILLMLQWSCQGQRNTSPYMLAESSIESPEPSAEGSEEAVQKREAHFDRCPDITPQNTFEETLALERANRAIRKDDSETIEELLCGGLSPDARFSTGYRNTWTMLLRAARYDAIKSARVLVQNGAKIDKPTRRRIRPLHEAAWYNSLRVAKLLIDSEADVDSRTSSGVTPLHVAAKRDSLAVAKLLVRKGANVESRNGRKRTPLHEAAQGQSADITKLLIESGASINKKDTYGDTPLHLATWWGYLEIGEILVDSGADVDAKGYEGRTPLHEAAGRNKLDLVKFLIKNGASKSTKNDDGDTPYDAICKGRMTECTPEEAARIQRLLRV